ncbi:MAG: hypothetical protein KY396_05680 [Actinobacteria bacterium]|nr:hypothetical protein [Actinomycetota bacterium]
MGLGISIFLAAVGAILIWGVTASVAGVSINTIGVILIVVGAIGAVLSLIALTGRSAAPARTPEQDIR